MGLGEEKLRASRVQCTLQMTSLPERDLALPFPELEASLPVLEQEWGCLEGVNCGEEVCPRWERCGDVKGRPGDSQREQKQRGLEVFAQLQAPPPARLLCLALGGARLFGGGENVHEGWVCGGGGGGQSLAHLKAD